MTASKFSKIAGIGFVGFCAASLLADKVNLTPAMSQMAGFAGGFLGSLVGSWRAARSKEAPRTKAEESKVESLR
jgi:hypothetical protein